MQSLERMFENAYAVVQNDKIFIQWNFNLILKMKDQKSLI